jgi:hypothetical protein
LAYQTGDIVTRVQQRVRDTGYSSTEIKGFLNDVQNDVFNEYRLPFMETSADFTLDPDDPDLDGSLPSDYVQAINLFLTSAGYERSLTYRDIREIEELYTDPEDTTRHPTATPTDWYYYGQLIKLFPVPDIVHTVTMRYYKKPTLLSNDSDVPELPSEFEELLVVGAAYRVLQVKDNYDQAGVLQNKYDELLQKLVAKYSQPQVGTPTRVRINRRALGKAHF